MSSTSKPSHIDAAKVLGALAEMFVGFREKSQDARELAKVLLNATASLPAWACIEAASRFTLGQVPRNTQAFAPTVAEFLVEVRRLVADEDEHQRLMSPPKMLPAPARPAADAEARARVAALAEEFSGKGRARQQEERERAAGARGPDPFAKYRTPRPSTALEASEALVATLEPNEIPFTGRDKLPEAAE